MAFTDKLKSLLRGREKQVKQGIDKAAVVVEKRVGAKNADKVDSMAETAKDAVDKLAK